MKKILKSLLVLLLVLVPVTFAQAKKTTTTKTTTVAAKAPNTVNMYVFYGDGCPHCAELEEYIKSNLKKDARVKDFINVVYYETWYDTTNQQFLSAVGQELEVSVRELTATRSVARKKLRNLLKVFIVSLILA